MISPTAIKEHAKGNASIASRANITRFKGLGEMNAETLNATTLDKKTRQALRVTVGAAELLATDKTISELMGKDVAARAEMIKAYAGEIGELDV